MQLPHFLVLLTLLFTMSTPTSTQPPLTPSALLHHITSNAARDNIDLATLPFHQDALSSILSLRGLLPHPSPSFASATKIDTHTHPIPDWFRSLGPSAAGRDTPSWNISSHLNFMADRGIKRSILSVSTPQANAFASPTAFEPDAALRKKKTVALARLLNEYVAEVCRLFPQRFSWLAVTALPYVEESVVEVRYAMEELGAVGVSVLTHAEGVYPGDEAVGGLWEWLEERAVAGSGREIVFIHPTDPVVVLGDGRVVSSRPCEDTFLVLG